MPQTKSEVLQGTRDLTVRKTLDVLGPLHGFGVARRVARISDVAGRVLRLATGR